MYLNQAKNKNIYGNIFHNTITKPIGGNTKRNNIVTNMYNISQL